VAEAKAEEGARGRRKRPAAGAPAAAARSGESLDLLHMAAFLGLKDDCQFLWKTYKSVLGSEAPRRSFGTAQSLHSASSSEVDAGRRFFQADPYGFEVVNYALLAITFLLVYSYSCLRIFCFRTTPTRSVFATMQSLAWEQCSDEGACLVTVHDV
jgi:hypothetical protein